MFAAYHMRTFFRLWVLVVSASFCGATVVAETPTSGGPDRSTSPASPSSPAEETPATSAGAKAADSDRAASAGADPSGAAATAPAEESADKDAQQAKSAAAEEARKKVEREQKRQALIGELKFDRRPSTILRAWSGQELEELSQDQADMAGMAGVRARRSRRAGGPSPHAPSPETAGSPGEEAPKEGTAEEEKELATFKEFLKKLRRTVTIGDWAQCKLDLADRTNLTDPEAKSIFEKLVESLASDLPPQAMGSSGPGFQSSSPHQQQMEMIMQSMGGDVGQRYAERHIISIPDMIGIIQASPAPIESAMLPRLAPLLSASLASGNVLDEFLNNLRNERDRVLTPRQSALLLSAAGQDPVVGEFLPSIEVAIRDGDREALNLLARHALARHQKEQKVALLEQAWQATLGALAAGEISKEHKQEALQRAVDLATRIRSELGEAWLRESFTNRLDRGQEIIAAIGTATARRLAMTPHDAGGRLKLLQLQSAALKSLMNAAPDRAQQWRNTLNVLAFNWLKEAEVTQQFSRDSRFGDGMRRDRYGNMFFVGNDEEMPMNMQGFDPNNPVPIGVRDILLTRPQDTWFELIDVSLKPRFQMVLAQLLLKVNEDAAAFPYVEHLATIYPERARELAEEFLRVWTRNHNPNEQNERTSQYMFMYGFEQRADRIPLTRSKQERNLHELSAWVARLRKLPIGALNEQLLVDAFATCHSAAEVYRQESVEQIFGGWGQIKPDTLAALIQRMRTGLADTWRKPDVQQANNTKRKKQDIEAEILRGYDVAHSILDRALQQSPDDWQLTLAKATVMHDHNAYQQEVAPSSESSRRRQAAFEMFAQAAARYAAVAADLEEEKQSVLAFDHWFYAALGASDLGRVTEKVVPDMGQIALIRQSLGSLPGEACQRHRDRFANALFTRMSSVNPACKIRYLRGGFDIIGSDHPQAHEARKVFDYYQDLVTEIKLDAVVDGSDQVGHEEPFGVYVYLRHTKEIERESGGFSKYLQNQNDSRWSWNYGRPTENYRDKFQEAVTEILKEQFEVLSITFNHPETQSRAVEPYGWRVTPYAYLQLKARGEEVDKLPPLRMDLDFLDTSGYVVLPIESATVPLDAEASGTARPYLGAKLTQTLDERQATEGRLLVEIKGTAHGMLPPLAQMVNTEVAGFKLVKTDDQGPRVTEFDKESTEPLVLTERTCMLEYRAMEGTEPARQFAFPTLRSGDVALTYQRYVDADLAQVDPIIDLENRYAEPSRAWIGYILTAIALAAAGIVACAFYFRRSTARPSDHPYQLPERLTPFTVLGLLKQLHTANGIPADQLQELGTCIKELEHHYFAEPSAAEPNLEALARQWLARSSVARRSPS